MRKTFPFQNPDLDASKAFTLWSQHEAELRAFLQRQLPQEDDLDDVMQELFIKLLRHAEQLVQVQQPRAWLFRVARNALTDRYRTHKSHDPLSDEIQSSSLTKDPVANLEACLVRNLQELPEAERTIIEACDVYGMRQADFASRYGLTLVATKARLRRARQHLRKSIQQNCQVRYDESGRVCCHVPRN